MQAFHAAKAQDAFLFWNHPGYKQPDNTTLWFDEHTRLLEQGMMHGIEVVNSNTYYPEAHGWCIEKNLTMFGNSDIHAPMPPFAPGTHRAMTLVFAKERTAEAIREALDARRTAVYHNEYIIGEAHYLKEFFENAVEIKVKKNDKDNTASVTFKNTSDLTFQLRKSAHDPRLTYFRNMELYPYYTLKPQSTQTIMVRLNDGVQGGDVNFIVENFLVQPCQGMKYTVKIE